jgi:hypothetical protein
MYKLRDWIDLEKIDWNVVYQRNPIAKFIQGLAMGIPKNKSSAKERLNFNMPLKPLNWDLSSMNPDAVDDPDKINWESPNVIDMLRDDPIFWCYLSSNESPNAIELLRENPENINWYCLSKNPAIFELDYDKMKESKREINQAVIAEVWHPKRMQRWLAMGFDVEEL